MVLLDKGKVHEVRPESIKRHVPEFEPPSKKAKSSYSTLPKGLSKFQLRYLPDISFCKCHPSIFLLMSKSISQLNDDLNKRSLNSLTECADMRCFTVFFIFIFTFLLETKRKKKKLFLYSLLIFPFFM